MIIIAPQGICMEWRNAHKSCRIFFSMFDDVVAKDRPVATATMTTTDGPKRLLSFWDFFVRYCALFLWQNIDRRARLMKSVFSSGPMPCVAFYSSRFCLLWSNNLMFHFIIHGSLVEIPPFLKSLLRVPPTNLLQQLNTGGG